MTMMTPSRGTLRWTPDRPGSGRGQQRASGPRATQSLALFVDITEAGSDLLTWRLERIHRQVHVDIEGPMTFRFKFTPPLNEKIIAPTIAQEIPPAISAPL